MEMKENDWSYKALCDLVRLLCEEEVEHQKRMQLLEEAGFETEVESTGVYALDRLTEDWNEIYLPVENGVVCEKYIERCLKFLESYYKKLKV